MFVIKLGGSIITDKAKECCFKKDIMNSLAKYLKKAEKEIILIHGAGSFGHIPAKKYNLNEGFSRQDQLKGFSVTHEMVQTLNSYVLKSLQKNNIPAVSISPHSIVKLDNHKLLKMDYSVFKDYLDKNFTPVTFGDVVLDKSLGFSICSGDLLMTALAEHFKPQKAIFVIDEDGLYASNPKKDKKAEFIKTASMQDLNELITTKDSHADVTGGMKGKVDTIKSIANLGIDTILVNGNKPDRLYDVLAGKDAICTIVKGEKI